MLPTPCSPDYCREARTALTVAIGRVQLLQRRVARDGPVDGRAAHDLDEAATALCRAAAAVDAIEAAAGTPTARRPGA